MATQTAREEELRAAARQAESRAAESMVEVERLSIALATAEERHAALRRGQEDLVRQTQASSVIVPWASWAHVLPFVGSV